MGTISQMAKAIVPYEKGYVKSTHDETILNRTHTPVFRNALVRSFILVVDGVVPQHLDVFVMAKHKLGGHVLDATLAQFTACHVAD